METKWIAAEEWPDLTRSMTDDGWWLADLCGVDRLSLAHGGFGDAHRPGVGGDQVEANEEGQKATGEGTASAEGRDDSPIREGLGPQGGDSASPPETMRFEIVAHWLHRGRRERCRVHVLAQGDPPRVPSIVAMWPTADFMEREAFDLVGIVFDGHPNLKRIMLPDEWEGHPLRKDYGVGKIPIEFIPQPFLQFDSPHQQPNSPEAGVSVDRLGQSELDPGSASGGMSHFGDTKINSETQDGDPS